MKRITVVCGHYGVGKSEVSVNLALDMRSRIGKEVTLVDLDVVNPYFRSREARAVLEKRGVRVIGNSLNVDLGVDVPAVPAAAGGPFVDPTVRAIIDLGGDPAGARALAQFRPVIRDDDVDLLYVVNAFRPETRNADAANASIRAIEDVLDLRVTGLINNSHLLNETEPRHLMAGETICRELGERDARLATRYVAALPHVLFTIPNDDLSGERIPLTLYLRPDWMVGSVRLNPGKGE